MDWLRKADALTIQGTRRTLGVDLSGHRPEDLKVVDAFLSEAFKETSVQAPGRYESNWIAIGAYLGEVFVRNLGGRWHVPTRLQGLLALASGTAARSLQRNCYVGLRGERVDVFRAARAAIDGTSKAFSLYGFFQTYARRSGMIER